MLVISLNVNEGLLINITINESGIIIIIIILALQQ